MQKKLVFLLSAFVITALAADARADERIGNQGPPSWVVDAWEAGTTPVVPEVGPPAWVVEAWRTGERPVRQAGPPPRVAARHRRAQELGLPGPPPEVLKAWENGYGSELPGPPEFVLELLGF